MRALVLLVLAVSTMTVMAADEEPNAQTNTAAGNTQGYQFGAYDMFQPRQVRWQARMAPQGWMGAAGPMRSAIVETDMEYYPKLINWLDKVGRRRR